MQKKKSRKCEHQNCQTPFSVWTRNKLTEGNGVKSRIVMISIVTMMMVCVISLINPTNVMLTNGAMAQSAEINTLLENPIIDAFPGSTSIIEQVSQINAINIEPESEETEPEIETVTETETIEIGPGVKKVIKPEDLMEDYNTEVYIAYKDGVNIRAIPSTDGEILGTLGLGDKIQVIKRGDGWLYTVDGNFIYENATSLEKPQNLRSLGTFKFTAYCSCSKCCGKNAKIGKTRSGTYPKEGRTISVDRKLISLGSKVVINGHEYIAEDTGSSIKGKIIDMYIDGHQRAKNYGIQYHEVFVYN